MLTRPSVKPEALNVEIAVDPDSARRWLLDLKSRLEERGHSCSFVAMPAAVPSASLDLLFELEQLIYRLTGPRGSDRIAWGDVASGEGAPADSDLTLAILYDGTPSESALHAALLDGRTPRVAVVDATTGQTLACGEPGTDNAGSVREASELVHQRTITLILMALGRYCSGRRAEVTRDARTVPAAVSTSKVAQKLAKSLVHSVVRRLYHLCCYAPHWQIGWRFVAPGRGVYDTLSLDGPEWRTITSVPGRFFADPFPIEVEGRHYIFFEDLDHRTQKGVISMVEVKPDGTHGEVRTVLEEPWHLSYPFLIEDGGQIYMIPESSANRSVDLYRADPFPSRWVKEATLLSGVELSDATVVAHEGTLWLFGATRDGQGSYSDTLSIYSAPRLQGSWRPHDLDPVLVDQRAARPAGNFFHREGRLWRPVQDCARGYGTGIGLAEVLRLDAEGFEQRVDTVLHTPPVWPGKRLHTLSRNGSLECIDGSGHSPRYALVGALLR